MKPDPSDPMKLSALLVCVAFGPTCAAFAQNPASPSTPAGREFTITAVVTNAENQDLTLQPDALGKLDDELNEAYTKLAKEGGPGEFRMPTLIYGPGVREARVAAPLRLTGLR